MANARTHSPAPFSYSPDESDRGGFKIFDANGRVIAWAETEADARLFATSPELLAFLKAIREANHGSDAAISKATGEEG